MLIYLLRQFTILWPYRVSDFHYIFFAGFIRQFQWAQGQLFAVLFNWCYTKIIPSMDDLADICCRTIHNKFMKVSQLGFSIKGLSNDTIRPMFHHTLKVDLNSQIFWSREPIGALMHWNYAIKQCNQTMQLSHLVIPGAVKEYIFMGSLSDRQFITRLCPIYIYHWRLCCGL